MRTLRVLLLLIIPNFLAYSAGQNRKHEVMLCGERIPVEHGFVANKLMNVIRKQVPLVNLPSLRRQANQWFPVFEKYLLKHGLPLDLKYIPVVESGFRNAVSPVGAAGYWQLMPSTARGYGLTVNEMVDERNDIYKSTEVACKLLKDYYKDIGVWALTLAGYNYGIGNINKMMRQQGKNYFAMQLNPETALYVYKIIAVKELFEYPEIYIKDFGYNVFNEKAKPNAAQHQKGDEEEIFKSMTVRVMQKGLEEPKTKMAYYSAHIEDAKGFKDGDLVKIVFDENIYTSAGMSKKGYGFKATGWLIDDRVYLDLNMGHELTVYGADSQKGIPLSQLKKSKKVDVVLKQLEEIDD